MQQATKPVNNTRTIARQLFGKRVPAAKDTHSTVEVLLNHNNENGVFYVVRAEMLLGRVSRVLELKSLISSSVE
jgi:S-adenosylmethionine:tRNA-ribosyltransferase-isomerase (queuine synthetase)